MPRAACCLEQLSPGAAFWEQGAGGEEAEKPFNYAAALCGEGCQPSSRQRSGVAPGAGSAEGCRARGRGALGRGNVTHLHASLQTSAGAVLGAGGEHTYRGSSRHASLAVWVSVL